MYVINGIPTYMFHIDTDNNILYVEINNYLSVDGFINQFIPEYKRTLAAFHGQPYHYVLMIPSTWEVNITLMGEFIKWMGECIQRFNLQKIAAVSLIPEINILAKVTKEALNLDNNRVGVFTSVDDMKKWLKEE